MAPRFADLTTFFIFRGDFGTDVILDFDVERDTLEIARGRDIKRVSDVLDHAEQQRNQVVIDFGDGNRCGVERADQR